MLDDDTEALARAVEAADFPELAAARAHLARLRLRVRQFTSRETELNS